MRGAQRASRSLTGVRRTVSSPRTPGHRALPSQRVRIGARLPQVKGFGEQSGKWFLPGLGFQGEVSKVCVSRPRSCLLPPQPHLQVNFSPEWGKKECGTSKITGIRVPSMARVGPLPLPPPHLLVPLMSCRLSPASRVSSPCEVVHPRPRPSSCLAGSLSLQSAARSWRARQASSGCLTADTRPSPKRIPASQPPSPAGKRAQWAVNRRVGIIGPSGTPIQLFGEFDCRRKFC